MHIAVYAFDGITMFHLSIPQMVFGTVSRLGLANWQVSLFTTTSESVTPPQEAAAPAEGAGPPPSTAPSRTTIRTSEGYILGGLGGPELASEADVVVVPAWFSDGRPAEEELRSLLKTAHARGACVVGLSDEQWGSTVVAAVVLEPGRQTGGPTRCPRPRRKHPQIIDELRTGKRKIWKAGIDRIRPIYQNPVTVIPPMSVTIIVTSMRISALPPGTKYS